jgi:tripartite-type tricarboxylate transporter receptor subunit TctC
MKTLNIRLAVLLACAASPFATHAADYPDRSIRLIVPYAVGGTTDIIARLVGNKLGAVLGQSVIIENRPGAGGNIGSAFAARQPADGYTLVMAVESSHAVNPNVYAKRPYDPIQDFAPISNLADVPNVLDVNKDLPAHDLGEFLKLLKASPGKYAFGSSGNGGLSHLNGEVFMTTTSTQMLHVPYKGLGPALTDLMAGRVQAVFDNIPSSYPLIKGGQIRPLAVAAKQRLRVLPDVPTYAELGLPALNNPSWFGLAAPAGTPDAVLDKLNAAVRQALNDPATAQAIENQGAVPSPMSRKEFAALMESSYGNWKAVVETIHFQKIE